MKAGDLVFTKPFGQFESFPGILIEQEAAAVWIVWLETNRGRFTARLYEHELIGVIE